MLMPMNVTRARIGWACLAVAATVSVGILAQQSVSTPTQETRKIEYSGHMNYGADPAYAQLTVAQQLDRALSIAGIQGVVEGIAGPQHTSTVDAVLYTDSSFRILAYYSRGSSLYRPGATIDLRVPGGSDATTTFRFEGAPIVTPGAHLFVFVVDQGTVGGGNTGSTLIASHTADVLELKDGSVRGQGSWASYSDTPDGFLGHLAPSVIRR